MGVTEQGFYFPTFLKAYCERYETNDPHDGCWAENTAWVIDAITGGKVSGLTEADIRNYLVSIGISQAYDRPGQPDGGYTKWVLEAVEHWVPVGTWYELYPTRQQLVDHLNAGGLAVLAGTPSKMPYYDRQFDTGFYDSGNGHSIVVQGNRWHNPEYTLNVPYTNQTISFIQSWPWTATGKSEPYCEALLFWPMKVETPVEVNMRITITKEHGSWATIKGVVQGFDPTTFVVKKSSTFPNNSPAEYRALVKTDTAIGGFTDFLEVSNGLFINLWVPIVQTSRHAPIVEVDTTPYNQDYVNTKVTEAVTAAQEADSVALGAAVEAERKKWLNWIAQPPA